MGQDTEAICLRQCIAKRHCIGKWPLCYGFRGRRTPHQRLLLEQRTTTAEHTTGSHLLRPAILQVWSLHLRLASSPSPTSLHLASISSVVRVAAAAAAADHRHSSLSLDGGTLLCSISIAKHCIALQLSDSLLEFVLLLSVASVRRGVLH